MFTILYGFLYVIDTYTLLDFVIAIDQTGDKLLFISLLLKSYYGYCINICENIVSFFSNILPLTFYDLPLSSIDNELGFLDPSPSDLFRSGILIYKEWIPDPVDPNILILILLVFFLVRFINNYFFKN